MVLSVFIMGMILSVCNMGVILSVVPPGCLVGRAFELWSPTLTTSQIQGCSLSVAQVDSLNRGKLFGWNICLLLAFSFFLKYIERHVLPYWNCVLLLHNANSVTPWITNLPKQYKGVHNLCLKKYIKSIYCFGLTCNWAMHCQPNREERQGTKAFL